MPEKKNVQKKPGFAKTACPECAKLKKTCPECEKEQKKKGKGGCSCGICD